MASNVDDILNDFIVKLTTISVANGYNTTPAYVGKVVKDMYEITEFPQISLMVGNSEIRAEDNIGSSFKESMNFYIVGYVNANTDIAESAELTTEAEKLISDIKKATTNFTITNINDASSGYEGARYFIDSHNTPIKIFRAFDDKQNLGMISLNFSVVSYSQDLESDNKDVWWNRITSNFESLSTLWQLY